MKKFLDSVHGYIRIPKDYCSAIIDTSHFQRLRRIEQTSIRSVFPCARHDRFIHSLGVFHIGSKIIDHLRQSNDLPNNYELIFESYRFACLLHDVGHSPFSHTFEEYFDNQFSDLKGILCNLVKEDLFEREWKSQPDPSAEHEKMSAIVALGIYNEFIVSKGASPELVARMIIGLKYENKSIFSYENAMIDLIHGDVIDADGLDYVCRDTWASGYCSSSVDIERLIDSIKIIKNNNGVYELCYTSKCLNEIESVLRIKTFQQHYVINHHKVAYEQRLLVKAMESAAVFHILGVENTNDEKIRKDALEKICCIDCLYKLNSEDLGVVTEKTGIRISLPTDDDFVSLMKYVRDDKYIKQWFSRNYDLVPLWKSKAEFYFYFDNLREVSLNKNNWIFSDRCIDFISKKFSILPENIWRKRATSKNKMNNAKQIKLFVNGSIIDYLSLFPTEREKYGPPKSDFYYLYVPKTADKQAMISELKKESSLYYTQHF